MDPQIKQVPDAIIPTAAYCDAMLLHDLFCIIKIYLHIISTLLLLV